MLLLCTKIVRMFYLMKYFRKIYVPNVRKGSTLTNLKKDVYPILYLGKKSIFRIVLDITILELMELEDMLYLTIFVNNVNKGINMTENLSNVMNGIL